MPTNRASVLDMLDFFIVELDKHGFLCWINAAAEMVGGYSFEEIGPVAFWDAPWFQHSFSTKEKVRKAVDHVILNRTPSKPVDISACLASGSFLKFELHVNPRFDDQGKFIGAIPHAVEIRSLGSSLSHLDSLADQLTEALEEEESKLVLIQKVMDQVTTPMTLVNERGILIFDNQAARDIVKTSVTNSLEDWQGQYWHLDGKEMDPEETPLGRCLVQCKEVLGYLKVVFENRPDTLFELEVRATPLYHNDNMMGAVCAWTVLKEIPYEHNE